MEPFDYIYHSTDMKYNIVKSGSLNQDTHFCCSLLHGQIPEKLPYYGNYRIGIDARTLICNVFDAPNLFYMGSSKQRKPGFNVWYHDLVVSDYFQPDHNEHLDLEDNDFLVMDMNSDSFLVRENNSGDCIRVGNRFIPEYHWVNVQVDSEIDLYCVDFWWD